MRGTSVGLAVVAMVLVGVRATQDTLDRVPAAIVNPADGKADPSSLNERDRFLFGSYSTTTYTVVSATTSTVFYSCLSGTQTARCQGRRKRKDLGLLRDTPLDAEEDKTMLEGSLDEEAATDTRELVPTDDDGKFAFTVWTTSRTTTSVTVIYTNTSTTIRISYYCIVGQIDLPAFPC